MLSLHGLLISLKRSAGRKEGKGKELLAFSTFFAWFAHFSDPRRGLLEQTLMRKLTRPYTDPTPLFRHGGRRADQRHMLDFSASINPLGPPASVLRVLRDGLGEIAHYPDPECRELTQRIAAYHNVDPEMVVVGNGSNELIYAIARAFRPKRVAIAEPTYTEYLRASLLVGAEVDHWLAEAEQFFLRPFDPRARISSGSAIQTIRPANSGRATNKSRHGSRVTRAHCLSWTKPLCLCASASTSRPYCTVAPTFNIVDGNNGLAVTRTVTVSYTANVTNNFPNVLKLLTGTEPNLVANRRFLAVNLERSTEHQFLSIARQFAVDEYRGDHRRHQYHGGKYVGARRLRLRLP